MPYKFKVGDRVPIVRVPHYASDAIKAQVGRVCRITEIRHDRMTPYVLDCDGETWFASEWNLDADFYDARELEAAPAKKTRKKKGK